MKKKLIMVLVLVIAAVVLIAVPLLRGNSSGTGGPDRSGGRGPDGQRTSSTIFAVRTDTAEIRTLQAYIEVNANVISGNQVAVMPDANGRLVSMRVNLGDIVQRGSLIGQVDPSRPGTEYSLSPVYAPISGRVVTAPIAVGSTVTTGTPLLTLAVNGTIEIEALIPERETGQLRTGLTAVVGLEAFPGETFGATLTVVAPVIDQVSRTRKITLQFNRYDSRIIPGMFARVKLNTRTYENVVSIPQDAIVESRGVPVVYVLGDTTDGTGLANEVGVVSMREVSPGVTIDGEVEIKSGLNAGDRVIVQGQQFLTDGAAVRVIGGR